jgi:hypothetical protein
MAAGLCSQINRSTADSKFSRGSATVGLLCRHDCLHGGLAWGEKDVTCVLRSDKDSVMSGKIMVGEEPATCRLTLNQRRLADWMALKALPVIMTPAII